VSDLSKKLNLSKPTLKEHLDILENAGFVKKISSENIWKYYEITSQGKDVLNPSGIKILLLSISTFIISSIFFIKRFYVQETDSVEIVNDNLLYATAAKSIDTTSRTNNFDVFLILAILLLIIGTLLLLYFLYKKYKR
jgi:DNA-binding transcriptional ArsR family regulator